MFYLRRIDKFFMEMNLISYVVLYLLGVGLYRYYVMLYLCYIGDIWFNLLYKENIMFY